MASIFLAKLIGPYCLIVSIGVLINRKRYQNAIEDFVKSPALLIAGVLALLFGLLIVLIHNIWVANWIVLVTIFGWSGIVKGVWIFVFPGTLDKIAAIYREKPNLLTVKMLLVLLVGLVLTFFGYFA